MSILASDEAFVINSKLIELASENQKVIANNIANAETPGYTRMKLDFQRRLTDAVNSGDLNQIENLRTTSTEDTSAPAGNDGNNVVLPVELNEMMQNSVLNNLLTSAFRTKLNILKAAVK